MRRWGRRARAQSAPEGALRHYVQQGRLAVPGQPKANFHSPVLGPRPATCGVPGETSGAPIFRETVCETLCPRLWADATITSFLSCRRPGGAAAGRLQRMAVWPLSLERCLDWLPSQSRPLVGFSPRTHCAHWLLSTMRVAAAESLPERRPPARGCIFRRSCRKQLPESASARECRSHRPSSPVLGCCVQARKHTRTTFWALGPSAVGQGDRVDHAWSPAQLFVPGNGDQGCNPKS